MFFNGRIGTEPGKNASRFREDVAHLLNLVVPLDIILLVDAKCIYPK
jgi:hypothetical protein